MPFVTYRKSIAPKGRSYVESVLQLLLQPPHALAEEDVVGAMQRPSARSHNGRPSRTNGNANAMRARRTACGNCFTATTHALTSTASATTTYCRTSEAVIVASSSTRPQQHRDLVG